MSTFESTAYNNLNTFVRDLRFIDETYIFITYTKNYKNNSILSDTLNHKTNTNVKYLITSNNQLHKMGEFLCASIKYSSCRFKFFIFDMVIRLLHIYYCNTIITSFHVFNNNYIYVLIFDYSVILQCNQKLICLM